MNSSLLRIQGLHIVDALYHLRGITVGNQRIWNYEDERENQEYHEKFIWKSARHQTTTLSAR